MTSHGFALNVTTDLSRFLAINPCGMSAQVLASLAALGVQWDGKPVSVDALIAPCAASLGALLGRRFGLRSVEESQACGSAAANKQTPELPAFGPG